MLEKVDGLYKMTPEAKAFCARLDNYFVKAKKKTDIQLMGKKAEAWELLLNRQKLYKVAHPASAAYRGGEWDCKDVFNRVNQELENQEKTCITW